MVLAMKKDLEIFRGAGAQAVVEATTIRALLQGEGIPTSGGPTSIVVAAKHYERASQLIAAGFPPIHGEKQEEQSKKVVGMRQVGR
jgi:hypothetical protein